MTARERRLAGVLGAFITVAVVGGGGYLLVWAPLVLKNQEAARLEAENEDKEFQLVRLRKDLPRLQTAVKRSLPADVDAARQEYDAAIARILREAKIPAAQVSVTPRTFELKSAPELPAGEGGAAAAPGSVVLAAAKRYAYTRIGFEVTLRKVELATVVDVLARYYRLNLLHQITKFTVKKSDDPTAETRRRSNALVADRPDLDVTFTTEALSVFGAEARKSLLPVPVGFAAAGGGAGYAALAQSAVPARGLTPVQLAQVLAAGDRDYSLLLVKDIFHGPPPKVEPPRREEPEPKEDTSAFIRITGLGRNPDGSGSVLIADVASRQEYVIDVVVESGVPTATVVKSYFTPKGVKKSYDAEPVLDISEATSRTAKKFRVIGLADDGLVLALLTGMPGVGERVPGPRRQGGRPVGETTEGPAERVYLWRAGQTLSQIKELTGADKAAAVRTAGPSARVPATPALTEDD